MNEKKSHIAKATGVVSGLTLVSRILGLIRDMVIASFFGAGMAADAFFVAFKIPNLLRRLVAEGSLSSAFVPIFSDELSKSKSDAQNSLSASLSFCLILTSSLAVLGMIYAEQITYFFSPGFAENPEKLALTVSLTRIMLPYIIFVSVLALLSSVLNCLGYFAIPAIAPVILNMVLITAVYTLGPNLAEPVYSLAFAVLIGGVVTLIPQVKKLYKIGFSLRLKSAFSSPAVRRLICLMLPSILSASVYQLMIFINTILASLLAEGSVSWLYYADRLFQFPLGVFTIALATVILPTLSKQASLGNQKAVNYQATKALNLVTFICLPAATGLYLLAPQIIEVFYHRGAFTKGSAVQTASALRAYSIGLWGISCNSILVRVFLAKKNTLIPAYISVATLLFNMLLSLMLMGSPESVPNTTLGKFFMSLIGSLEIYDLNHIGLALAGSIASSLSAVLLYFMLKKVKTSINLKAFFICTLKSAIACIAMALLLQEIINLQMSNLFTILLAVPGCGVSYFVISALLKNGELDDVKGMLIKA